jgi:hypothetical protein
VDGCQPVEGDQVLNSFINFPTISSAYKLTVFLLQTLLFCITMLVRDPPSAVASAFRFHSILEIKNAEIDLNEDDLLYNFVTRDS